jgi:hypothetical protein
MQWGGGKAGRIVAVVGVGGEAVDVLRLDAGILARRQDRLQRQHEFRVRRVAVLIVRRLADADHRHLAAQRVLLHASRSRRLVNRPRRAAPRLARTRRNDFAAKSP